MPGMKCDQLNYVHKGGLRELWAMGKLGHCRMLAVVYAIVTGVSYRNLKAMGFMISPGRRTSYVKNMGMVLSRRKPDNKYWLAQWDESSLGKRKYNKF